MCLNLTYLQTFTHGIESYWHGACVRAIGTITTDIMQMQQEQWYFYHIIISHRIGQK